MSAVLITAGPTEEPIDAVRFLSNRSSGRMGVALARAAAQRGCNTTLLLGPTELQPPHPSQVTTMRFRTAEELRELLAEQWPRHDVLIMAAAVSDYRPRRSALGKLRRTEGGLTLELEPTPDLLAECAARRRDGQLIVGFALEPVEDLLASARAKLQRKGADAIVANPLETMGAEAVCATVVWRDGRAVEAPRGSKEDFARWLLGEVV